MANNKHISFRIYLFTTLYLIISSCCTFHQAPLGIHGIYSRVNDSIYNTNNLSKDSVLMILKQKNLVIKKDSLHNYDPQWDSLRYLISNIPCDTEYIEAYVEFSDKKSNNITLHILWFNSIPTKNDSLFRVKTEAYYKCFEALLKDNGITK